MKTWGVYILAAIGFAIYGATMEADRDGSGAIIGEGIVDAFHVRVGDCFNDTESLDEGINSLPGIPCSEPHDNEAYAVLDLTVENYPEGEAMSDLANESCMTRFEAFVGLDYDSSSLDVFAIYPSVDSWKQNDREVICSIYDMNAEKLVGSMKNRAL